VSGVATERSLLPKRGMKRHQLVAEHPRSFKMLTSCAAMLSNMTSYANRSTLASINVGNLDIKIENKVQTIV